jgi:B-box zinc finger
LRAQVTSDQTDDNLSDLLYCKKHAGEQGKYVCQSCQVVVCTACIVHEHADHDVAEMTSYLRQQQQDVSNLHNMVQSKNDQLKTRIQEIETLRQVKHRRSVVVS